MCAVVHMHAHSFKGPFGAHSINNIIQELYNAYYKYNMYPITFSKPIGNIIRIAVQYNYTAC